MWSPPKPSAMASVKTCARKTQNAVPNELKNFMNRPQLARRIMPRNQILNQTGTQTSMSEAAAPADWWEIAVMLPDEGGWVSPAGRLV